MSILKEFRDFAARGNVIELAVGVIIGVAFGKVVASLVADVVMPPLGMFLGGADFSNLFVALNGGSYPTLAAAKEAGAPTINYGVFLNQVFEFLVVAFVIFLLVRQINRLKAPPAPETPMRDCPFCLSKIPAQATKCAHCTAAV